MRDKRKVKKILISCVVFLGIAFFVSVIYLAYLIISFSDDLDNPTSDQQQIVTTYQDGTTYIETEHANALSVKLDKIQVISIVICGLMLFDFIIIILYSSISKAKNESLIYKMAYIDEITGLPTKAKHRQDVDDALKKHQLDYA